MTTEKDPELWNAVKEPERVQSSLLFWTLLLLGVCAGSVVTWWMWPEDGNGLFVWGALSYGCLVFIALFFLAVRFQLEGAREAIRATDGGIRPFVLYLRAFQADRGWHGWIGEILLAKGLRRIGLPVCIGRPGERLPPGGIHRLYFRDEDWRASVLSMASSAACIVLLMGEGRGLTWEISHILDNCLTKTILLVPARKHQTRRELLAQYGVFVPSLQSHYPPEYSSLPFDLCPVEFRSPSRHGTAVTLVPEGLLVTGYLFWVYWMFYGVIWTVTFAIPPLRRYRWLLDRRGVRVDYEATLEPVLERIASAQVGQLQHSS